MDARSLAGRVGAFEGGLGGLQRLQLRLQARDLLAAEAGADAADVDQPPIAVDAGDQGSEGGLAGGGPSPDHDFLAAAALGLGPGVAPAGAIGRVQALGYDPFQVHAAGGLQHRISGDLEVLDVLQPWRSRRRGGDRLEPRLAVA